MGKRIISSVFLALSMQNNYTEKVIIEKIKDVLSLSARPAEQIPVKITINTTIYKGSETESYELTVLGRFQQSATAVFLRYDEVMEVGKVTTTVKLNDQGALIMRSGALNMRMTFRRKLSTLGTYQTPFGTMQTEAFTEQLEHVFESKKNEGSLDLLYDLTIQGEKAGTYHLKITYKEEGK